MQGTTRCFFLPFELRVLFYPTGPTHCIALIQEPMSLACDGTFSILEFDLDLRSTDLEVDPDGDP